MEVIVVKLTTGTRLLRSLVRNGKAQRRTVSKLVSQLFAAPKPKRQTKAKPKLKPLAKSAARAPALHVPSLPLAAPHVSPAPGKWLAAYYTPPPQIGAMPGRRMSYWLYLPDHVSEQARNQGLPLVVMLHGCRQTATQFAQGTRMNQLAERAGYAVLYPQQLVSAQAQRCWKWYDKATQDGGGDVPTIVGIIDKVSSQYRIDRSRVYIAGMSAGAGMANIVALNHPQLIAAAVPRHADHADTGPGRQGGAAGQSGPVGATGFAVESLVGRRAVEAGAQAGGARPQRARDPRLLCRPQGAAADRARRASGTRVERRRCQSRVQ